MYLDNKKVITERCLIKEFVSRKNNVALYEQLGFNCRRNYVVVKKFRDEAAYSTELDIYERLMYQHDKSSPCLQHPKLLDHDDFRLLLTFEYIEGNTVLEMLEQYESKKYIKQCSQLLIEVLKWLEQFYDTVGFSGNEVFGDINLRNFLMTDEGIVGLDYENVGVGNRQMELIRVLAMYMLYDPMKSNTKKTAVHMVQKTYLEQIMHSQNEKDILCLIEEEMKRIQLNRRTVQADRRKYMGSV